MSIEESLPPNFRKLDVALRSIGYSFEAAVADVIDNSIDAQANHILLRVIISKNGDIDLAICDNGRGMSAEVLKEAMRFGSDVTREIERLGKFGLGLKLASLSQAKEVHVLSAQGQSLSGRAWLEHGIANGFNCTIFDEKECRKLVDRIVPAKGLGPSGTLVLWSRLYRVGHFTDAEEHAQKLMRRLEGYLSLAFHRFLSGKARKVNITIDMLDRASGKVGIPIVLDPLDPFGYLQGGHADFPQPMLLAGPYAKSVKMTAHIWPPNSSAPEYKLPGGANSRQGFYFYRNNRLIQGGGWNGIREAEPHSSLARIEVDVAADFDIEVSLDVKKVEIQLPQSVITAIKSARTGSGIDFKKYLSLADSAYRKRQITHAELPLIPSRGLPAKLVATLQSELRLTATKKFRELQFGWAQLGEELFFAIDRDAGYVYLNRSYRQAILHGAPGSVVDAPLIKCLLFFVLEEAVSTGRVSTRIREQVEKVNRILVEAVKYERVPV